MEVKLSFFLFVPVSSSLAGKLYRQWPSLTSKEIWMDKSEFLVQQNMTLTCISEKMIY